MNSNSWITPGRMRPINLGENKMNRLESRKEMASQALRLVHSTRSASLEDVYDALDELRAEAEELATVIESDIRNRDA